MQMPRVVVVEHEPFLLQSLQTALSRLPGLEVVAAHTVDEALETLHVAPAVVISDLDLPGRSGLELLGELGARGLKPRVFFLSARASDWRAQVPAHIELLEKPIPLAHLRELVTAWLPPAPAAPAPFGLADYLQLASMGHHSVDLEVSGPVAGRVVVVEGEAWSAEDLFGHGVPAFHRLVLAPHTVVTCRMLAGEPEARTLWGSCESLLLECARLADEARAARPPEPPPDFDKLFDAGIEASLTRRYAEALDAFRAAAQLRPDDGCVRVNIARLEVLLGTRAQPDGQPASGAE